MGFGQLVIGPPGSGKTTYCNGMAHYFSLTNRPCAVINLDPANHDPPYDADVSVEELITLDDAMREFNLGPNGAMVYCMEYLAKNLDWLRERVAPLVHEGRYLLVDCPGQVELFNAHDALKTIVTELTRSRGGSDSYDLRLCVVHLVDAHLCADPTKYIAALMLSLSSMLHMETPHVNLLSKVDLMDKYGELDFNLEYYADVMDLSFLADRILRGPSGVGGGVGAAGEEGGERGGAASSSSSSSSAAPGMGMMRRKYSKLTRGLCELVEDFSLVNFLPLAIEDKTSVQRVLAIVDKSIGYFNAGGFSAATIPGPDGTTPGNGEVDERTLISHRAVGSEYERNFEVQERFFKDHD